jgi:hypothetical protein
LFALSEHIIRHRWSDVRGPTESELRQTTVLSLPIDEASAKIRTGPPLDDEEDYDMEVWAGVLPLRLVARQPISDPRLLPDIDPPEYVLNYSRPKRIMTAGSVQFECGSERPRDRPRSLDKQIAVRWKTKPQSGGRSVAHGVSRGYQAPHQPRSGGTLNPRTIVFRPSGAASFL